MNRILCCGAAALLLTACARASNGMGPEDRRFIETMVELRRAAQEADGDVTTYQAQRVGVLSRRGVTEDELRAYIRTHARDLDHLAAVWESINVRLSLPAADPH